MSLALIILGTLGSYPEAALVGVLTGIMHVVTPFLIQRELYKVADTGW